jgi:excisionase family DNA binding protein
MVEAKTYTPEEFADRLRVSVRTVYRQIKAGTLKAERIGRQYRIVRYVRSIEPTRHVAPDQLQQHPA